MRMKTSDNHTAGTSAAYHQAHHQGAHNHRGLWLAANRAVVKKLEEYGFDLSNPSLKAAVAITTLAVLDEVERQKNSSSE